MSRKVTGWWCELCNREYTNEDAGRFGKKAGVPECPRCYTMLRRIEKTI